MDSRDFTVPSSAYLCEDGTPRDFADRAGREAMTASVLNNIGLLSAVFKVFACLTESRRGFRQGYHSRYSLKCNGPFPSAFCSRFR